MPSKLLSHAKLNSNALEAEVEYILNMAWQDSYREFICGEWKTLMLYNHSGQTEMSSIYNYQGRAKITPLGKRLSYLNSVIESLFDISYLKYARLVMLGAHSAIIPHQDYLELGSGFYRFHIPIKTNSLSFYLEEDSMFLLNQGDICYLDARSTHAAACLDKTPRIHLLLDFCEKINQCDIFRFKESDNTSMKLLQRPPMSKETRCAMLHLAQFFSLDTFYDVIAILIKYHYQCHAAAIFSWLENMAHKSQGLAVIDKVQWLKRHCILTREKMDEAV